MSARVRFGMGCFFVSQYFIFIKFDKLRLCSVARNFVILFSLTFLFHK